MVVPLEPVESRRETPTGGSTRWVSASPNPIPRCRETFGLREIASQRPRFHYHTPRAHPARTGQWTNQHTHSLTELPPCPGSYRDPTPSTLRTRSTPVGPTLRSPDLRLQRRPTPRCTSFLWAPTNSRTSGWRRQGPVGRDTLKSYPPRPDSRSRHRCVPGRSTPYTHGVQTFTPGRMSRP